MKLRTFKCDCKGCKKSVSINELMENFPYEKGWIYIYELILKVRNRDSLKAQDKHYCCLEHFQKSIKDEINTYDNGNK